MSVVCVLYCVLYACCMRVLCYVSVSVCGVLADSVIQRRKIRAPTESASSAWSQVCKILPASKIEALSPNLSMAVSNSGRTWLRHI